MKREEQQQKAKLFFNRICDCKTIKEVETLYDEIDDAASGRVITKRAYKWLSEECDDRISYLIEQELRE